MVVAIDVDKMDEVEINRNKNVKFVYGDLNDATTQNIVNQILHNKSADTILCDMAPKFSGQHSVDSAKVIDLAHLALKIAELHLKKGGSILIKLLKGGDGKKKKKKKTIHSFYAIAFIFLFNNIFPNKQQLKK